MKAVLAICVVLGGLVSAAVSVFVFNKPKCIAYHYQLRTGQEFISRVEVFRTMHRRLPESSQELGFDDPKERVFYQKINNHEYCLSFGTTLGQSETYWSSRKKWEEGRECVADK
jgi:hypothetical protein